MNGCLYTCPGCKDHYLYAPNGLPANIQDPIICSKCGHDMICVEVDMEKRVNKVRNVHLGNCTKMSQAEALQKARAMKAEALAIKL